MQAPLQARNDSDAAQTDTARTVSQKQKWVLADNRPEAMAQRKLAEMMNNSPRVLQQQALSNALNDIPPMVAQRHEINALFGDAVKPQGDGAMPSGVSREHREEKQTNTGLSNQLNSRIESLSGMSMDHVKVHYNADRPAQLQAHAYAQGSEIHLRASEERHLPREAWHVVQQAQGRVRPTLQMKTGAVNDDPLLEKEGAMMSERAAQLKSEHIAQNPMAEERIAGAVTQRVAGFFCSTLPAIQLKGKKRDHAAKWVLDERKKQDAPKKARERAFHDFKKEKGVLTPNKGATLVEQKLKALVEKKLKDSQYIDYEEMIAIMPSALQTDSVFQQLLGFNDASRGEKKSNIKDANRKIEEALTAWHYINTKLSSQGNQNHSRKPQLSAPTESGEHDFDVTYPDGTKEGLDPFGSPRELRTLPGENGHDQANKMAKIKAWTEKTFAKHAYLKPDEFKGLWDVSYVNKNHVKTIDASIKKHLKDEGGRGKGKAVTTNYEKIKVPINKMYFEDHLRSLKSLKP